jgi:hypothetical protein
MRKKKEEKRRKLELWVKKFNLKLKYFKLNVLVQIEYYLFHYSVDSSFNVRKQL